MLKNVLILLALVVIAGLIYSSVYVYRQWNKWNGRLDSDIKSDFVFVDLCNSESKDKKCLQVVHQYFGECRKIYTGEKITFLNVRDESIKFLKATYTCIENKSHYKLPSLGDYLLHIHDHKTAKRNARSRAIDRRNDPAPSAASAVNLAERKEKFLKQNKASCLKSMTSVNAEHREDYCECAIAILRSNMQDNDFRLYLDRKISPDTLMKRSGDNFDRCPQ